MAQWPGRGTEDGNGNGGGCNRKYETVSGWSGSRLFIFRLKSAQKRKMVKTGAGRAQDSLPQRGGKWQVAVAMAVAEHVSWRRGLLGKLAAIYAHSSRRYAASG